MAWLSRFIAAILISVITIAVLSQVFNSTLLNSHYLDKTAKQAGVYTQLSTTLTNELVDHMGSGNQNNQIPPAQARSIIQSVLTPSFIEYKVNTALASVQAYYKGNGPPPIIGFSDAISKLQAAGLPINTNNQTLNQTINLGGNVKVKDQVNNFEKLKLIATLVAIGLLCLLIFLSWEEHRWKILPDLSIILGIILGLIATLFILSVGVVDKYGKIKNNSNDLVNVANAFAKGLTHSLGEIIGIIAVILFVGGVVGRVLLNNSGKPKQLVASKKK